MDKILTVVIPTYNMEKYLENCLDSFIYDKDAVDLEVLIVNDGSKDKSLNIAKSYEEKYPNIFKVVDKENGGHGSTINAGLQVATGKYFKVVDADDWVDTAEFAKMLEYLRNAVADCVVCDYTCVYERSNRTVRRTPQIETPNTVMNVEEIKKIALAMHSSTFKTDKIRDVRIQEKCFYVDVEYNVYSYFRCETIVYLPLNVYQYRLGRVGQSMGWEGLHKHRDNKYTVINNILNFYQKQLSNIHSRKQNIIFGYVCDIVAVTYWENNSLSLKGYKNELRELVDFDERLKQYPEFYDAVGDYKYVKKLRKRNFKFSRMDKFVWDIKQIIKKMIGRG